MMSIVGLSDIVNVSENKYQFPTAKKNNIVFGFKWKGVRSKKLSF